MAAAAGSVLEEALEVVERVGERMGVRGENAVLDVVVSRVSLGVEGNGVLIDALALVASQALAG